MIQVTPTALKHAARMREKEGHAADAVLRVGVKGGGCAGFSYVLRFEDAARADDQIVTNSSDIKVVVDPKSALFLDGLTLDFSEGLGGKGFEFQNPQAKSSCGCGQSFSV